MILAMQPNAQISEAWRRAAADLGIRVTAQITVEVGSQETAEFRALVHDFGGPMGTLVCSMDDSSPRRLGDYFVSAVNPEVYQNYDRQTFVDALEDWGWFGKDAPPTWYRGISPWG